MLNTDILSGYITMNYNLSKSLISTTDFYNRYEQFMVGSSKDDRTEFFDVCGKQHYRLLSYLSTLVNDAVIIDIGTHRGQSALALSYNARNTVHTFDIEDRVSNTSIRGVNNINFHMDNLFDDDGREKWRDTILKSSFIFLDVDPHNGTMEMDLYEFLKDIGYTGFVICDDIWHFKEMRDIFWYKIPHTQRFDMTEVGHNSGTGIFTFNNEITFSTCENNVPLNRIDNSNWTLVTAYFNLTKCKDASYEINQRDSNYYMSHSMSTLNLPYNLVIYCDTDSVDIIKSHRPEYLNEKTRYVIREFDEMMVKGKTVSELRDIIIDNRAKHPYNFDNRNTASYYLFCMTRYVMLNEVIERNEFESTHFCWINFCIERMGISNVYRLNESLAMNRNKFSTCYIDYIPYELIKDTKEYFAYGRCSMCSGFFTGNRKYMFEVCDLIQDKFIEFLENGYGHADEQLYSPVYFENPHLFEQYYGDYNQMITNYKQINENIYAPVHNFIKNSFEHGNYRMCADACNFVLRSHNDGKCNYDVETHRHISNVQNECLLRM
jgi:Bacterial protein of unknown function (HtrL_YibB)